MVSDFLDVARIEAGELSLQLDRADAREIVMRVVELFQTTTTEHTIKLSLPEGETSLMCDAQRLEQVLGNLISNAVKYSPGGGTIEVRLHEVDRWAVVEVADQGVGISAEELPRLFEPFRRGGSAAQAVAIPGVGLGLFVVKRIVEAHEGRIEVESLPAQGSIFRVRLPLLREESTLDHPAPSSR
jgi:signal transduction histidine kinase